MQRVSTPGCTPAVDAMALAMTANNVTSVIAAIALGDLADKVMPIVVAAAQKSPDALGQVGGAIARAFRTEWGDDESVVSKLRKLLSLLLGVVQRSVISALGRSPALQQAGSVFAALKRGFPLFTEKVDDFVSTLTRDNSRETATAVSTLVSDIGSFPGVSVGHQVAALVALLVLMAAYAAILMPSALWLPLTALYIQDPSTLLWIAVRVVLFAVGGGASTVAYMLIHRAQKGPLLAWGAVVCFFFFWLQTMILDAIVWPYFYHA